MGFVLNYVVALSPIEHVVPCSHIKSAVIRSASVSPFQSCVVIALYPYYIRYFGKGDEPAFSQRRRNSRGRSQIIEKELIKDISRSSGSRRGVGRLDYSVNEDLEKEDMRASAVHRRSYFNLAYGIWYINEISPFKGVRQRKQVANT